MTEEAKKDLAPVAEFLDAVIASIGGGAATPMLELRRIWPDLAGSDWADRARPVSFDGTALVVEVADGASASMFRYETSRIARGVASALETPAPPRIAVRVARSRR